MVVQQGVCNYAGQSYRELLVTTAMCEGKFLVKTNVTTDNVIRQVTVENFRFGIRVIKKPEGRWICQDLNNKTLAERSNKTETLQLIAEKDDQNREEQRRVIEETILVEHSNNKINESKRVHQSTNNSVSSKLNENKSLVTATKTSSITTATATKPKSTCSSVQGPGLPSSALSVLLQAEISERREKPSETRFNKQHLLSSPPVSNHKAFFKGQDIFGNFTSFNFGVKRQRSIKSYRGHVNQPNSILYERLRSCSPFTLVPHPIQRTPTATTVLSSAGQLKTEDKNSTTSGFIRSVQRHHHHLHHQSSSNTTEDGIKNQYLSKVLGSSPLLKLQLLNLTTVPLNDQEKVPDLLPVETITR